MTNEQFRVLMNEQRLQTNYLSVIAHTMALQDAMAIRRLVSAEKIHERREKHFAES